MKFLIQCRYLGGRNLHAKLGCRLKIGDGSKIRVMTEPWLQGEDDLWISSPQEQAAVGERIMKLSLLEEVTEDQVVRQEEQNGKYSISTPRLVSWHPPPENVIKVNVDGSSIGNQGPSGFGGLLRKTFGGWITGFAGSCGFTSNINAELQVILHGLDIAWNHGFRNVICESDSQTALKLIQEGVPSTHPYAPLVNYIQSLIHKEWKLFLVHTLREGNASADWLAKLGASLVQEPKMFSICPSPLSSICLVDSMGIQFPRA
ncbi:hypothetical protein TSUD_190610 [Trifolium subterraneum]|uniref:RNase H type-1 domain-containing protein n=1 Tax=Trifolium subterraneum TaxID=3900 RepID=A0A2Z6NX80_TRISU|nr:hypothetical protein TSUD_190610 [Trifolium subterraneum]